MTRQAVEAVRDWLHDNNQALRDFRTLERDVQERLANDLLTLCPMPSLKELEKILQPVDSCIHDHFYQGCRVCQGKVIDLMVWATGRPTEKAWCCHLIQQVGSGKWMLLDGCVDSGSTVYEYHWTVCPICGTHKPEPG